MSSVNVPRYRPAAAIELTKWKQPALTVSANSSAPLVPVMFAFSIASALANEFTEAVGDIYYAALIELGLILFLITTIVLALAKLLLMRLSRSEGTKT